ncbi:MAG: hypothetical protein COX62_03050 [Deltaproteobacteria bacterium CG_4_10_14_0_2_um_filter_43_8]|nr:MAG: hypothetical protein COV43_09145 [Deltaproteobacteria bacterium CG11_big_fil_rev_8_21_14_0_20_42_23]PJA21184.1 MAG: hypothetical protein COX62_03050 [Deltaproteobacteria bacterium CG_4_10_14_0_2_um_filter_43_8]PJC64794.1 MAG: hypothetical protein CO021_02420 [Deltaproteobacteria bacterium CG_4_9_14_0_2_um_filter_42_21]
MVKLTTVKRQHLPAHDFQKLLPALLQTQCFFFSSNISFHDKARYSIFAYFPQNITTVESGLVTENDHTCIMAPFDAIDHLECLAGNFHKDAYLPFSGGLIGCINYHTLLEAKACSVTPYKTQRFPDVWCALFDGVFLYDHLEEECVFSSQGWNGTSFDEKLSIERVTQLQNMLHTFNEIKHNDEREKNYTPILSLRLQSIIEKLSRYEKTFRTYGAKLPTLVQHKTLPLTNSVQTQISQTLKTDAKSTGLILDHVAFAAPASHQLYSTKPIVDMLSSLCNTASYNLVQAEVIRSLETVSRELYGGFSFLSDGRSSRAFPLGEHYLFSPTEQTQLCSFETHELLSSEKELSFPSLLSF